MLEVGVTSDRLLRAVAELGSLWLSRAEMRSRIDWSLPAGYGREYYAMDDDERVAIREVAAALRETPGVSVGQNNEWHSYDSGLSAWLVVTPHHAHVSRCGPRGWRTVVTMEIASALHHHVTTLDMFASMDEAKACAEAIIYAHQRGVP